MSITNVIRTLTIMGKAVGMAEAAAAVKGVQTATDNLNKSAIASTSITETQAKRQLSLADAVEKSERRFNSALRAQQDFEKVQRQMNAAVAQNPALQERANAVLALAKQHFDQAGKGAQMHGAAMQAAAAQAAAMASRLGPLGGLLSALGPAGVAAAAGIAVLFAASVKAVEAYRKLEEHQLTLNSMLQSTGMAAGRTADDIEKMATEIGNISEVRKAATELVKFGSISKDVFDRTLVAADDLSAAGFGSISSAAEALGKALESPADGLTRLRRAGIIFSDSQIAMVKNMQETGRLAEAQRFILDELAKKVGGAGAARDQGLAGSYEALGDATQRLLENWGKQITQGTNLTAIIHGIAAAMDGYNSKLAEANKPENKLKFVDNQIDYLRKNPQVGIVGTVNRAMGGTSNDEMINRLLERRKQLLNEVADAEGKAGAARAGAAKAADIAAEQRRIDLIKGVVEALDRETESLKKNAFERAVDKAMRQAEVVPGSAGEGPIRQAVNTKMATEAVEQYVEATKLQTANQIVQARSMTMSAAEAARYKSEQEMVNKLTADGSTLTAAQRLQIAAIAKDFGNSAGAIESVNVAMTNRGRLMSGRQGIEMAQLEASLVGKTTEEQERLTAQLRIKHQLEQDAAQRNATVDPAHLKALQDQAGELAKINAQTRMMDRVKDVLEGAASGFVGDLAKGVTLMDALANAAGRLGQQLIDIGTKQILNQLMAAASGPSGGAASAGGVGGAAAGAGMSSMLGGLGAAAGPLALVAGIGLSLFSANAAAAKAEKERIERAKKAWEDARGAADKFMIAMQGNSQGSLQPTLTDKFSETMRFALLAQEAGDMAARVRLRDAYNTFWKQTTGDFIANFDNVIAAFESGLGPKSPFAAGQTVIKDLGDTLLGFVEDAKFIAQSQLSPAANGDRAFSSAAVAQAEERARAATQAFALAQLQVEVAVSDTSRALTEFRGRADALQGVLVKLGMGAVEAASAIQTHLNAAIAELATNFRTGLEHDINEALGAGWVNSIIDLWTEFRQVSADAVEFGTSAELVSLWLQSEAQALVNSERLLGDEFDVMLRSFPALTGQIHEFVDVIDVAVRSLADINAAKQGLQDQLFTLLQDQDTLNGQLAVADLEARRAREAEVAAGGQNLVDIDALSAAKRAKVIQDWNDKIVEDTRRAADEARAATNQAAKSILEYLNGLSAGSQSTLSPQARLSAAQGSYNSQIALAQSGNLDAQSGITKYAEDFRTAAQAMFASSSAYQAIETQIKAQLLALPAVQAADDPVVAALRDTITAIQTTTTSVNTVANAIAAMQSALQAAINSNSPVNIAAALAGHFNTVDTNLNGLIDFGEMQSALSGMASNSQLRDMFTRLDTDTSGGLSKLELIRTATDDVLTATDAGNTLQTTENELVTTQNLLIESQSSLITTLNDLNTSIQTSTAAAAANSGTALGSLGNLQGILNLSQLTTELLALVRDNTLSTSGNVAATTQSLIWAGVTVGQSAWATRLMAQYQNTQNKISTPFIDNALPIFHTGGLVGANDNEVYAKLLRNEYVMQPSAVASIGVPTLDYANSTGRLPSGGGDMGVVAAEIRALRSEVAQLRAEARVNARNGAGMVAAEVRATGDAVVGELGEVSKKLTRNRAAA